MDLNFIRSAVTLSSFVIFIVLMVWTYRPARRTGQDVAAQLPFLGEAGFDTDPAATFKSEGARHE